MHPPECPVLLLLHNRPRLLFKSYLNNGIVPKFWLRSSSISTRPQIQQVQSLRSWLLVHQNTCFLSLFFLIFFLFIDKSMLQYCSSLLQRNLNVKAMNRSPARNREHPLCLPRLRQLQPRYRKSKKNHPCLYQVWAPEQFYFTSHMKRNCGSVVSVRNTAQQSYSFYSFWNFKSFMETI